MRISKVGTGTLTYVKTIAEQGCANDCQQTITINKGLPLPCKEFNFIESAMLRKRALEDDQLFNSGFVRVVDQSSLHNNLKIQGEGIDVGEIRTEDAGHVGLNECKYVLEGIDVDNWEKDFYVTNTGKHLELCPKHFVGKKLSSYIGDRLTDYSEFEGTDLADIIIAAIIERYNKSFVAKFILLSVWGTETGGDDGVLAKAWYAWKNQYFHTLEFDFSQLVSGNTIEAIQGGKRYSKSLDADFGGDADLMLVDFVDWIASLKTGRERMYDATVDLTTKKVIVVSRFAVHKITMRLGMSSDGSLVDWSMPKCLLGTVPTVCLQNAMPINDTPKMFNFQEINETNFVPLFKAYMKEFMRYLHRNGFADVTADDVLIGIDPELMLERDDAVCGKFLAGGVPVDFMNQIGLSESRFKPLNALNNTGLFFMTVQQNILVLSDATNQGNTMADTGQVKIKDLCNGKFAVLFDNPLGSAVEHFGAFASNLCGSWFVADNNLDNREPFLPSTKGVLACYSPACVDNKRDLSCTVSATVSTSATYDADSDTTQIQVDVMPTGMESYTGGQYAFELTYAFSDGTNGTATDSSFVITLPQDQTNSGLILTITGQVAGLVAGSGQLPETYCSTVVVHTDTLGTPDGVYSGDSNQAASYCEHTYVDTNRDVLNNIQMQIFYADGTDETFAFVDTALHFGDESLYAAIEDEIEAIVAGSIATVNYDVVNNPKGFDISIENVTSTVTSIRFDIGLGSASFTLDNGCTSATSNTK